MARARRLALWAEKLGLAARGTRILAATSHGRASAGAAASGYDFDVGGVTQETMDAYGMRTAG